MVLNWQVLRTISFWKRPFHILRYNLAYLWLKFFPNVQIIGITGSVGKTTTKEAIAAVLSEKFQVVKSAANLDPVFNIPQTILKLRRGVEKLVLEMGVEYPDEMDFYLSLVQPQIGVVTKISQVHTEFLGDLEGVVKEKGKLIESLLSDGWAILNWDDPQSRKLSPKTKARVFYYGTDKKNCQLIAKEIKITPKGLVFKLFAPGSKDEVRINFQLLGKQNVFSALAAASVGIISGMALKEIKVGLEKLKPQPSRLNLLPGIKGSVIIDDTYNASPVATIAAIDVLKNYPGKRKFAVIGEMKELGSYAEEGHREVGKKLAKEKIDYVLTLGGLTGFILEEARSGGLRADQLFQFEKAEEIVSKLKKLLATGDVVLVKGSRAMRMERIISALKLA